LRLMNVGRRDCTISMMSPYAMGITYLYVPEKSQGTLTDG
jgi:hypothetical protein